MKSLHCFTIGIAALCLLANAWGQEDPGKTPEAMVRVTVYFATNDDPSAAGPRSTAAPVAIVESLQRKPSLRFDHYRIMGEDTQPLFRSYENWAEPLKPSDEIMVRFEAQAEPTPKRAVLDLELWLSRKKIIKTNVRLEPDRSLWILGPRWRGGQMIISVALANPTEPANTSTR